MCGCVVLQMVGVRARKAKEAELTKTRDSRKAALLQLIRDAMQQVRLAGQATAGCDE